MKSNLFSTPLRPFVSNPNEWEIEFGFFVVGVCFATANVSVYISHCLLESVHCLYFLLGYRKGMQNIFLYPIKGDKFSTFKA